MAECSSDEESTEEMIKEVSADVVSIPNSA